MYLINILPSKVTLIRYPFQFLLKKTPNYNNIKIFGYLFFPWLSLCTYNKLEPRATPCIFSVYCSQQKNYMCLQLDYDKIYTSHDVRFIELVFPSKSSFIQNTNPSSVSIASWFPHAFIIPTSLSLPATYAFALSYNIKISCTSSFI